MSQKTSSFTYNFEACFPLLPSKMSGTLSLFPGLLLWIDLDHFHATAEKARLKADRASYQAAL
ncbi:MAG TPA: hypothetical protein VFN35_34680, partial [Ktedonobacteraceae bacterium]|nr:hypothetical protein [Ktedonobacteraceae bacterium]